jgi:hypothetical protein
LDIVMEPGWQEEVLAATDVLFLTTLGPRIYAAARAYCPVWGGANSHEEASIADGIDPAAADETPGALRDSIEFHLTGHSLIVSASGGNGRVYAADVELGHRIVAWGHATGQSKGPQAFLRPALYTIRAAA